MSDKPFLDLDHEESLSLLALLRENEPELNDILQALLIKVERQLFAVHSIEEMERMTGKSSWHGTGR